METDYYVTAVQSALSGKTLSFQETLDKLDKVKEQALKRIKKDKNLTERDVDDLWRKLFIVHILNSDISKGSKLRDSDSLCHLTDLFETKAGLICEIVANQGYWKYLIETLPLLPSDVTLLLLHYLVKFYCSREAQVPSLTDDMTFGFLASTVIAARRYEENSGMNSSFEELAKKFFAKDSSDRGSALLYKLQLLKMCSSQEWKGHFKAYLQENDSFSIISEEKWKEQTISVSGKELQSICTKLVVDHLKAMSISEWMDFVEKDTERYLKHSYMIFWKGDVAPSNLQLLIRHVAFECIDNFDFDQESKDLINNIAKKYEKEVEFDLSGCDLHEILSKTKEVTDWKLKYCIDHLLTKMLDQVLKSGEAVKVLLNHSELCAVHLNLLFNRLNTEGKPSQTLIDLSFQVFTEGQVEQCDELYRQSLETKQHHKSSSFDAKLRLFLNQIVSSEKSKGIDSNLLKSLVMQSPVELLETIVESGIENGGRADIVAKVLVQIKDLSLSKTDNAKETLLTKVLEKCLKIELKSNDEKRQRNLVQLVSNLSEEMKEWKSDFIPVLSRVLLEADDVSLPVKICSAFIDHDVKVDGKEMLSVDMQVLIRVLGLKLHDSLEKNWFHPDAETIFGLLESVFNYSSDKEKEFIREIVPVKLSDHFKPLEDRAPTLENATFAACGQMFSPLQTDFEAMFKRQDLPEVIDALDLVLTQGPFAQDEKVKIVQKFSSAITDHLDQNRATIRVLSLIDVHEQFCEIMLNSPEKIRDALAGVLVNLTVDMLEQFASDDENVAKVLSQRLLAALYAAPDFPGFDMLLQKFESTLCT